MNGFASPLLTKTAKNTGREFRQASYARCLFWKTKVGTDGFDREVGPKYFGKDTFNVVIRRNYVEE